MVSFTARGLVPAVFTPLNDDYTVNVEVIPKYAEFLVQNGMKSVLVGGTTGQHMKLSVASRKKVIEAWVQAKTRGLHIMAQVGGAPLQDVLELAAFCEKIGVDSLLTLPELYFKPSSVPELVTYIDLVSKSAPSLPVLYYHIPAMSKVEMHMPTFVLAASERVPNFRGIKSSSSDLNECVQVSRVLREGQEVFLGAKTLIAPAAVLGIRSIIASTFNLYPRLAQSILDTVDAGDVNTARRLQEQLFLAAEALTSEGAWLPVLKAGMEIVNGINVGPPAPPQTSVNGEAKQRIANKLKALKMD